MKDKILKHKNLALFILLVIALAGTYIFEERSNKIKEAAEAKKNALLNSEGLGEITSIQGIKLNFERRGGFYYDKENNMRLREERLNEFFTILGGLKVKTFLNQEEVAKVGESFYIPDPSMKMTFNFDKGQMTFILGKKLDYDQTFYMQVVRDNKSQIVIVSDESPDPGVYESDDQYKRSDAKFKRLQVVFFLTNKYFYDTRVFKDFSYPEDKINFETIRISTFRNKAYSISFKDSTTKPAPPKGIEYFDENWVSFHQFLSKLEGKSIYYPANPALLDEILSQFEVVDRENRKYTLTVYKKYGEENGYFLKTSLDNIVYQLKPEDAQYFFVNVQDFWRKVIAPKEKSYNLSVTFYDGKTETVKVEDKELFKVLPTNNKYSEASIRALEFKRLIEFFKMEGNHVNDLDISPTDLLKKNILRVQFDNRHLSVILEENEAIIVDLDNKVMVHHLVGEKLPFSIRYEDYFVGPKK